MLKKRQNNFIPFSALKTAYSKRSLYLSHLLHHKHRRVIPLPLYVYHYIVYGVTLSKYWGCTVTFFVLHTVLKNFTFPILLKKLMKLQPGRICTAGRTSAASLPRSFVYISKIFSSEPLLNRIKIFKSNLCWQYFERIATSESTVIIQADSKSIETTNLAHRNIFVWASS